MPEYREPDAARQHGQRQCPVPEKNEHRGKHWMVTAGDYVNTGNILYLPEGIQKEESKRARTGVKDFFETSKTADNKQNGQSKKCLPAENGQCRMKRFV